MSSFDDTDPPPRSTVKQQLQAMDDFDFEHLVADIWARRGWKTEVEQQSADAGVDVRATQSSPYRKKALIQAKRYSHGNAVGSKEVQQYSALKQQEQNVDEAIIVTTSRFTTPAERRGRELNVKLVDGDDLVDMIVELDAYDLVEHYLDEPQRQHGGGARGTRETHTQTAAGGAEASSTRDPGRWWQVAVVGAIVVWAAVWIGDQFPETSVMYTASNTVLLLATGVALIALWKDRKRVRSTIGWSPSKWYLIGVIFGCISIPVYIVRRSMFAGESMWGDLIP